MIKLGLMPFYGNMKYKVYCMDFENLISAGATEIPLALQALTLEAPTLSANISISV